MGLQRFIDPALASSASPGRLNFGLRSCAASGIADVLAAGSLLSGLNVPENCFDVVIKAGRVLVAYGPDFSYDRVRLWRLHDWVPLVRWVCKFVQRHIEYARESAE